MKKNIYISLILILSLTKINAQFVGYYSLKNGGVDMPSSTLFILPDHTFVVFSAGMNPVQGNWKEESKDKIKLESDTTEKSIYCVYAIADNTGKGTIQFSPLERLNLYVSFSKDAIQTNFQPLFDENWSCLDKNFETIIPSKNATLKLVSPADGLDFSEYSKFPVLSYVYTFKLSQKFTSYRVFIDGNAKRSMDFEIKKHEDDYIVQKKDGHHPITTERNDLSDKIINKIEDALIPWQINELIKKGITVEKIQPISKEKIELEKPVRKPLFISKCE